MIEWAVKVWRHFTTRTMNINCQLKRIQMLSMLDLEMSAMGKHFAIYHLPFAIGVAEWLSESIPQCNPRDVGLYVDKGYCVG